MLSKRLPIDQGTKAIDMRTSENFVQAHYSSCKPSPIKLSSVLIYICMLAVYSISSHSILLLIPHTADRYFFKANYYQNMNAILNTAVLLSV